MKPLRWLSALTVLLACMALLTAPADADARKHDSKGETQARKNTDRKKQADADRELWLERTRNNSEIMSGKASLYSKDLHNSNTASGYRYDMYTFTAAHRTLPMGTVVRVTDHSCRLAPFSAGPNRMTCSPAASVDRSYSLVGCRE